MTVVSVVHVRSIQWIWPFPIFSARAVLKNAGLRFQFLERIGRILVGKRAHQEGAGRAGRAGRGLEIDHNRFHKCCHLSQTKPRDVCSSSHIMIENRPKMFFAQKPCHMHRVQQRFLQGGVVVAPQARLSCVAGATWRTACGRLMLFSMLHKVNDLTQPPSSGGGLRMAGSRCPPTELASGSATRISWQSSLAEWLALRPPTVSADR